MNELTREQIEERRRWIEATAVNPEYATVLCDMALRTLDAEQDLEKRKLWALEAQEETERAEVRIRELEAALERADLALADWVNTYAPEYCDKDRVRQARYRIQQNGGTLAYIADVVQCVREALACASDEDTDWVVPDIDEHEAIMAALSGTTMPQSNANGLVLLHRLHKEGYRIVAATPPPDSEPPGNDMVNLRCACGRPSVYESGVCEVCGSSEPAEGEGGGETRRLAQEIADKQARGELNTEPVDEWARRIGREISDPAGDDTPPQRRDALEDLDQLVNAAQSRARPYDTLDMRQIDERYGRVRRALSAGVPEAFQYECGQIANLLADPENHNPQVRDGSIQEAIIRLRALAQSEQGRAPAGWKLVPVQPTVEMADAADRIMRDYAGLNVSACNRALKAYRAMLAAAPQPQEDESDEL